MPVKIAINGYGRIGRNVLRALYEGDKRNEIQIIAINDLGDANTNAHLTRYDSAHGPFPYGVEVGDGELTVDGDTIRVCAERDPEKLPWKKLGVDIVLESTGFFASKDKASAHLRAGANKVVISAPAGRDVDATIVYGVNHHILKPSDQIISNASCTTNCLAPVAKVLHDNFIIKKGLMTTIHSYTNDQRILDLPHSDLRRARAAGVSIIPTTTGAAKAVSLVLPEIAGRLDGMAIRVPTPNVSLIDLVVEVEKISSAQLVNNVFEEASLKDLKNILRVEKNPLVSIDYNGDPYSSIIDGISTKVMDGNMVKVLAWYDNEWGYSNRVKDLLKFIVGN